MPCKARPASRPAWSSAAERWPAYDLTVSHEHGKVGEVAAGTGRVGLVGLYQAAALGRPVAQHGSLRVVPEGAVSIEVVFGLLCGGGQGVRSGESPSSPHTQLWPYQQAWKSAWGFRWQSEISGDKWPKLLR